MLTTVLHAGRRQIFDRAYIEGLNQSRTKMQLKLEDLDFPPPDFHHCGDPGVTVAFRNFAAKAREQA